MYKQIKLNLNLFQKYNILYHYIKYNMIVFSANYLRINILTVSLEFHSAFFFFKMLKVKCSYCIDFQ